MLLAVTWSRGFSEAKRIVTGTPLTDNSMKGLITVREAVRNCGGAENVPVNLLSNVKKARVVKEREELEAMRKREEEER